MRDLINLLSVVNESTGLAGRKPGDTFKNTQGEELIFNDVEFFPQGGGELSPEELDALIDDFEKQGKNIQWLNAKSSRSGGVGVASFTGGSGEVLIGRYLQSINPNKLDNYIPNSFNDFKLGGKAAEKTQSQLTPQDLLTNKTQLSIAEIMNQLAQKMGTDHPLYSVAHQISSGKKLPLTFPAPVDISFSAFRDYFCEILQPIAIIKGSYTGNAGEAARIFLDGTFADTLISFDHSKTAGLSDSILEKPDGRSVKISSKGGKGATASAKNLIDSIDEMQKTPAGRKLLKTYADVIEIVREIQTQGQANAPLYLGVKYKIISKNDAIAITELKRAAPVNLKQIDNIDNLSPNLKKLAKERNTDSPEVTNLFYHLTAAVAHKAAEKINEKTNFSKAAADILNNGALVQVYTKASQGTDTWTLSAFDTVYPDDGIKGVYLTASKTYYSTGIKGNFTFRIDKGRGKPTKEKNTDPIDTGPDPDLTDVASDIVNGKRKKRPEPIADVGREKRSR